MNENGFEPARRELCPDGTCIGLIGADGQCKVCGAVGASAVADPRHQGMVEPRGEEEEEEPLDDDRELCPDGACVGLIGADGRCGVCGSVRPGKPVVAAAPAVGEGELEVDDDQSRELCPDGACIGLIGPNGRCKVCGTARG